MTTRNVPSRLVPYFDDGTVTLYRAADTYFVGTFRIQHDPLPEPLRGRPRVGRAVPILLSFKR